MGAAETASKSLIPRNGRYPVVVLAGGPADIANDFRRRLAPYGVELAEHREWEKPRQIGRPLPAEVDMVLVLTDMLGHSDFDAIRRAAGDTPVVLIHRKWADTYQRLYKAGLLRPWNGAPGPARGRKPSIVEPIPPPAHEEPAPALPEGESRPMAPEQAAWRVKLAAELARIQAGLPADAEVLVVLSPTNMQLEFPRG